nr:MAG TPA: hypothetical protein [Caudoviricetes sp.]
MFTIICLSVFFILPLSSYNKSVSYDLNALYYAFITMSSYFRDLVTYFY